MRNKQKFHFPYYSAIHLFIATAILAIGLRTWLVMGLVAPVTIAGSSMVPTLRGSFVVATCPKCQAKFDVGTEFVARTAHTACPRCRSARVPLAELPIERADRLWIDLTAFAWRKPRRWEVVVLRQPDEGRQLCIKRVVALPGETVRLSAGEVWVNGKVVVKPFGKQLAMRQLVYRCDGTEPRWHSARAAAWNWSAGCWRHSLGDGDQLDWLRYLHTSEIDADQQPITDEVSYNASVSRRLNQVHDFMLAAEFQTEGEGIFALEIRDRRPGLRLTICPSTGTISLSENGRPLLTKALSTAACRRLRQESNSLVLSNFDRQMLLVLNDRVELRHPLAEQSSLLGTARPVAIGVQGLEILLRRLTLYRDIYYSLAPAGVRTRGPEMGTSIRLDKGQYFVLGDNSPVSVDSRVWGPVSGRLLLGRPLGVR